MGCNLPITIQKFVLQSTHYNPIICGIQLTDYNPIIYGLQSANFNATICGLQSVHYVPTICGLQSLHYNSIKSVGTISLFIFINFKIYVLNLIYSLIVNNFKLNTLIKSFMSFHFISFHFSSLQSNSLWVTINQLIMYSPIIFSLFSDATNQLK